MELSWWKHGPSGPTADRRVAREPSVSCGQPVAMYRSTCSGRNTLSTCTGTPSPAAQRAKCATVRISGIARRRLGGPPAVTTSRTRPATASQRHICLSDFGW